MTREEAKNTIKFLREFFMDLAKDHEEKIIKQKKRGEWVDLTEREGLPIGILEEEQNKCRTKPEPKYRPFKDAEECLTEMQKHKPFGWIKAKEGYFNIVYIN